MTNKKIMASKTVLHVFPNTNTTSRNCELRNSKNLLVAIPKISSHMIAMMTETTPLITLCSLLTAVFVSFNVRARALRSLKTLT